MRETGKHTCRQRDLDRQTDRERERERDRQTDRERERETDRQTDRDRERETERCKRNYTNSPL